MGDRHSFGCPAADTSQGCSQCEAAEPKSEPHPRAAPEPLLLQTQPGWVCASCSQTQLRVQKRGLCLLGGLVLWFTVLRWVSLVRSRQGEPHPCCTSHTREGSQSWGSSRGTGTESGNSQSLPCPSQLRSGDPPLAPGPGRDPELDGTERGNLALGDTARLGEEHPRAPGCCQGDRNSHAQLPGEQHTAGTSTGKPSPAAVPGVLPSVLLLPAAACWLPAPLHPLWVIPSLSADQEFT